MSIGEVTRLEIDETKEKPALDIPALEYGTQEMAENGEKAEVLLTHPEETLTRGFAEEGTPRRFAPGGTVYHGDTECLHLAYPSDQDLHEFEREAKGEIYRIFSDVTGEDLYWYGRDLLVDRNGDPAQDPQVAGLALMNGGNYSIARTCSTTRPPSRSTEMLIDGDGLTDVETYNQLNYYLEPESDGNMREFFGTEGKEVQTVEEYLEEKGLAEESYEAARELQDRERGIEPRSCVTGFRPTS